MNTYVAGHTIAVRNRTLADHGPPSLGYEGELPYF